MAAALYGNLPSAKKTSKKRISRISEVASAVRGKGMFKPIMQANQNECGLCVVAMMASFYGFHKPISYYRQRYNIGRDGMNLKGVCCMLSDLHLEPAIIKSGEIHEKMFEKGKPYIVCVRNHYIILEKIKNGKCHVADPAKEKYTISVEELKNIYSGYIISVDKQEGFEGCKDRVSDFRHVLLLFKDLKVMLSVAIVFSILCNLVTIIIPILLQNIVDLLVYENGKGTRQQMVLTVIGVLIAYLVITMIRNVIMVRVQGSIIHNLSSGTMKHLLKIHYSYFDNRPQGDVVFKVNLVKELERSLTGTLITIIIGFTTIAVIAVYTAVRYSDLFPMLLAILAVIIAYVYFEDKRLLEKNNKQLNLNQYLSTLQVEVISDILQIKCRHLEEHFNTLYQKTLEKYVNKYQDNQKSLSNFSLNITMAEMFIPIFAVMFAAFYSKGIFETVGQLLFIYIVIGYFVRYSTSFANAFTQLYLLKSSLVYINDLLDEKEIERNGKEEVYSFKSLELKNVFFKYNDNQKYILNKLSMKVLKGQKVSIVGLSGTGKTTIIKLIANLYRPAQGSILINGEKELNQIDDKLYGQMLGIVMQQPIVFNRTIRENLVMDAANVSEADIEQALRMVNLWEDINIMPMKLNTVISGQGGNLSGGQIQRLTIARALIMRPQVLLLDEATSSVDVENEKLIFNNLKRLSITLIVISHRLSTVADSDMIYVLKEGTFVENGKHDKLVKTDGLYANLYKNSLQ